MAGKLSEASYLRQYRRVVAWALFGAFLLIGLIISIDNQTNQTTKTPTANSPSPKPSLISPIEIEADNKTIDKPIKASNNSTEFLNLNKIVQKIFNGNLNLSNNAGNNSNGLPTSILPAQILSSDASSSSVNLSSDSAPNYIECYYRGGAPRKGGVNTFADCGCQCCDSDCDTPGCEGICEDLGFLNFIYDQATQDCGCG